MLVKARFQLLVAILLSTLIGGILLLMLILSLRNQEQHIIEVTGLWPVRNEVFETAISNTMTAKSYPDTPSSD